VTEIVTLGDCTLIHGDCREVLPTLGRFDAVITDPPYGIGFKYDGEYEDFGDRPYMDLISSLRAYPVALLQYPEEMMRLVVPVMGAPDEVLAWVYPSNIRRQFRLWGLWGLKADFSQVKQPARNPEAEKVKALMVDSYDWWEQPQVKNVSAEKTAHPCQIPVTSVERVLRLTNVCHAVDPFMGSGTTGVACVQLGRKFTGIERERKYFDIAYERISRAQAQGQLIPHEQPKQVQEVLV